LSHQHLCDRSVVLLISSRYFTFSPRTTSVLGDLFVSI
jgi:hypothetical protein